MSTFLKRDLAPLTGEAWAFVDAEAKRTLEGNLSARKLVDFNGPRGLDFSAINLGRLQMSDAPAAPGVKWGVRELQPLLEVRVPFDVNIWELDNLSRGAADVDIQPIQAAARKAALFEETLIYFGFEAARVQGMLKSSSHRPAAWNKKDLTATVESAVVALQRGGVGGPYALVLGSEYYEQLMAAGGPGYPPSERVKKLLGGPVAWSPALQGGVLFSTRGGDFELTVGLDLSVGFCHATKETATLYLTESLTFRVLEPLAVVALEA